MKYGLLSGLLWGLNAVILSIALGFSVSLDPNTASMATAFLHDASCAIILLVFMGVRGRLKDTWAALKTRNGRVVMLAALLGGPLGMSGYLAAINNIGPGYTAIISAFYPAFGTLLAVLVLKEKMKPRQIICLLIALAAVMIMGASSAGANESGNPLIGIFGALLCVFGWGSEAVILAWGMRDEALDNQTALQIRETTSALLYGCIALPLTGSVGAAGSIVSNPGMAVVFLAALAGTTSYLFYYKAIDTIGAARGMAVNISYSAWAVIFAFVLTGVVPTALEVICCIAIMVNTVLSASSDWSEFTLIKKMKLCKHSEA